MERKKSIILFVHLQTYKFQFYFTGLQTFADELTKYVSNIDAVLQDFGQPIFYETPKFHTSLLWCLPLTNQENNCQHNEDATNIEILEKRLPIIF